MRRSTTAALAVFCTLSVLAIISFTTMPVRGFLGAKKLSLADADKTRQTVRILISRPDSAFVVRLEKKAGLWWLVLDGESRYPAQTLLVTQFLADLAAPRAAFAVPGTPKKPFEFDAARTTTVRLEMKDGSALEMIEFGPTNATEENRFIRTGTGKTIIETADTFASRLDLRAASWIELSVFRDLLSVSDIQTAVYEKGAFNRRFIRGKNTETEKLQDVLERLRCLDITNIPVVPEETVSLGMGNGQTMAFTLAALDTNTAILTVRETGAAYIVGKKTGERIGEALGIR